MDSSNSGSFQSSSGGGPGGGGGGADNEEYDSRTQSISSFFNPSNHFNPNLNHLLQQQQLPPPSHHHQQLNHHRPPPTDTTFFNPSSTSSFSPNLNPLQDSGPAWTGAIRAPVRPDQNLSGFDSYQVNHNSSTFDTNTKTGRGSDHHHHHVGVTTKNPKKRTRASRRAPTTVLTTDTTNFRQMVQEFTGIPTAPFATAPFSRRLDLFGRGSDGAGSLYPLRPSPQKVQQQQQPPPFLNSTANIVESGSTSNNNTTAVTSSNYNLPPTSIHEFQRQPSSLLDLQNPMLSFQSLLQANDSSGLQNASKRWRVQDEKLESFEDVIGNNQNIGGSKLNSGLENVVSSRSGGDQVQGNESSWICPSN